MKSRIFWTACALAAGIVFGEKSGLRVPSVFPLLISAFVLISASLIFARRAEKSFWPVFLSGIFFLGLVLHSEKVLPLHNVPPKGPADVSGSVASFPSRQVSRYGRVRTQFLLREHDEDRSISVSVWDEVPGVEYGAVLEIEGEFLSNEIRNPGGFDARAYDLGRGVSGRFSVSNSRGVRVVSKNRSAGWVRAVGRLAERLSGLVRSHVPEPEGSVARALLIGDRADIPSDVQDDFKQSGTAHLIAISGLNIGMAACILIALLRAVRVPMRAASVLAVFFLAAYCVLTGWSPSVLRSTVMAAFFFFAYAAGRESEIVTSISWSAILILIFAPYQIFDLGFQLSYLTVFFIAVMVPFEEEEERSHSFLNRAESFFLTSLKVSLAAWLGSLPLIAKHFYIVTPVSLLANLVLIAESWAVTVAGFAFLLLGSMSSFLAGILGDSLWFLTHLMLVFCRWFAAVPFGHFYTAPPSVLEVLMFYGILILWVLRKECGLGGARFLFLVLCFANFFIWKEAFRPAPKNFKVTFLDVGHGDSALLQFPGGGTLLIDTGAPEKGRSVVLPFLLHQGILHLDGILLTHSDSDHAGGAEVLMKNLSVGAIFRNPTEVERPEYGARMIALERGDGIGGIPGAEFRVFSPGSEVYWGRSSNDRSIVLQVIYGKHRLMFCGDAGERVFEELNLYGANLQSQVMKVPHHGSRLGPEGQKFFTLVHPKIAVISEPKKSRFHLPSPKTVDFLRSQGAEVLQTGIVGAVEFTIGSGL